ncbi:hypothetical protein P3T23_005454 [Paraburkholderia sp. GAS448]|jgi:hypothetical protein|uniref:hypothetical protein n=1 Tax=Paraburkholderia sp. GAS448 TaxID=3035136 RepID=UPI003D1D4D67
MVTNVSRKRYPLVVALQKQGAVRLFERVDAAMKDGEKRKPATVTYRGKLRVSGVKRVVKATAS